jgi:hypothetical protein
MADEGKRQIRQIAFYPSAFGRESKERQSDDDEHRGSGFRLAKSASDIPRRS